MKVMVISPHPDDETLGCGATLLKHKKNKDKIYWLNVTKAGIDSNYSDKFIKKREQEIKKVCKSYKFDGYYNSNFPTKFLDQIPTSNLIDSLNVFINKIKPNKIFIPSNSDVHSDHKIVYSICQNFAKTFRYPFVKKILSYETISETNFNFTNKNSFNPNVFEDVTFFLNKKISIMKIYKSELKKHPFPRSVDAIKSLAILRGSQANYKYAEGFELIKEIYE
jgi:N-acetylglucosamine malate deacetylase 1